MRRRVVAIVLIGMLAACAGGESESSRPPSDLPSGTDPSSPPTTAPHLATTAPGEELYPGFEFDRVTQMAPADLPEGIPVPVPAGGEIDPSIGAFEGELLYLTYPGPYFPTAVAFYGTWLQMEHIDASPLFGAGGDAAGWEFDVGGVPVRVEIMDVSGGSSAVLNIYWG